MRKKRKVYCVTLPGLRWHTVHSREPAQRDSHAVAGVPGLVTSKDTPLPRRTWVSQTGSYSLCIFQTHRSASHKVFTRSPGLSNKVVFKAHLRHISLQLGPKAASHQGLPRASSVTQQRVPRVPRRLHFQQARFLGAPIERMVT